jgi:hypothetical protein
MEHGGFSRNTKSKKVTPLGYFSTRETTSAKRASGTGRDINSEIEVLGARGTKTNNFATIQGFSGENKPFAPLIHRLTGC